MGGVEELAAETKQSWMGECERKKVSEKKNGRECWQRDGVWRDGDSLQWWQSSDIFSLSFLGHILWVYEGLC